MSFITGPVTVGGRDDCHKPPTCINSYNQNFLTISILHIFFFRFHMKANSDGGSTVYGNDSDDDTVAGSQAQNLDVEKDDTDADAKKDDKADSDGDSTVYGNDSDDDTVAGSHAQNLAVEKDGADADAKKDDKADSDGGSTVYGNDSDDDTAAGSHAQDLLVEKDDADAKKDDNDDDDDDDDDAPVEDDVSFNVCQLKALKKRRSFFTACLILLTIQSHLITDPRQSTPGGNR